MQMKKKTKKIKISTKRPERMNYRLAKATKHNMTEMKMCKKV